MENESVIERLDRIILLLEKISKPPSMARRILDGFIVAITILSVISVIDILRQWLGG